MLNLKENYIILRIMNFLSMIIILLNHSYSGGENRVIYFVIILVYIINSQVRVSYLKQKKLLFYISICLEIIIGCYLYYSIGSFMFLYIFISIIDAAIVLNRKESFVIITVIYILSIYLTQKFNYLQFDLVTNLILNTLNIFTLGALGFYLNSENSKKVHAQVLYDKLRISEEKLIKANKELEQYSKTIEELTLHRERNRVSRELHDSVGHTLSTLIIQLQAIKTIASIGSREVAPMLEEIISFTKNSLVNVRRTVRELRPLEFEVYQGIFPIEKLIKNFEKMTGVNVKLILSKEKWEMTSTQSDYLYRIVQESLSNSLKHGNAKNIQISIQFLKDKIYSQIKDDGNGCVSYKDSIGLKGIRERVEELRGTLDIITSKELGFEINITLPKDKHYVN